MLKTTTLKAKNNIKKYVVDSSRDYLIYDYGYTPAEVDSNIYSIINQCFYDEYVQHNLQFKAGRISRQDLFEEYAKGLPLGGLFDYYLHSAVDTLGDILEESETEKASYTEEKAERMLTRLIYREMTREAKRI